MKLVYFTVVLAILTCQGLIAQNTTQADESGAATYVGTISMRVVPSLKSQGDPVPPPMPSGEQIQDGRSSRNLAVPGKDPQTEDDLFKRFPHPSTGTVQAKTPELVFDAATGGVGTPSDPSLAVGLEHVFIVFNTGFMIYDLEGNIVQSASNVNQIFSNGGCCDLTVSYDRAADRWIVSYLFVGSGLEVAISSGSNPVTSDWFVYSIPQVNDYNKLSVWSDGYYITENTGGSNKVWAMERDAMLAGEAGASIQGFPLPGIATSGFFSPQALNVTDDNMPAAGNATFVFLQDDAYGGISSDHIKLWTLDVDWDTPGNSSMASPVEIPTTPFISIFDGGSFANLTQPGGGSDIDAVQATIMNQAQFRKFPTYNSALFSFVIDTDASAGELAGIRWYELRQDGDGMPWSVEQEGTYSSPDGKHAWMSSLMMDQFGNIGMGYTAMAGPDTPNPTDFRVSSYYTGRFAADAPGTMTVAEELISAGTNNVPGVRYCDYNKIDINPNNDKEFWFINEYMSPSRRDVVGVFQIASDFNNDIGAVAINAPQDGQLSANEDVTITIFNYGLDAISDFEVSYQIDGGAVVTEDFIGTIESGSSAQFTFATLGDFSTEGQTYEITATTIFGSDEFPGNDTTSESVTHLFANDTGVSAIISPTSGTGLADETVTVEISNYGFATQTSIPVFYSVDGGTPVQETYTGSIDQGDTDTYTFTASADLSFLGDYAFVAGTELGADAIPDNDDTASEVSNFICQPSADCAGFNDGVTEIQLADQDLDVTCGTAPDGYTDETDVVFNFTLNENPFDGVYQVGFSNTSMVIFIDFNDNNAFEESEVVAQSTAANADVNVNFTLDFSDAENVTTGMHLMRLRSVWDPGDGDLLDPCGDAAYGRTVDYTANVSGTLVGLEDDSFLDGDITLTPMDDDQFFLQFITDTYSDRLPVTIFDMQGQTLAYYTLTNNGSGYSRTLDMSYVNAGVYLVRVGDADLNVVKRIVVR
jgi:hypothetical protein